MTGKKRWFSHFDEQLKNNDKQSDIDISWSSSSTEQEDKVNWKSRKRRKITFNKHKILHYEFSKHNSKLENKPKNPNRVPNPEVLDVTIPSKSCNHSFEESPVIGHVLADLSPVLTHTNDRTEDESPVIGKRNILKKLKSIKNDRLNISPDLFPTQPTLCIDTTSPECTQNTETIVISQLTETQEFNSPRTELTQKTEIVISQLSETQLSGLETQKCEIEPYSSQGSSQAVINSNSESTPSVVDNDPVLYYHIVPKKKKYRKGGLASMLHKALQIQQTHVAIWKHEVYLSKLKRNYLPDSCTSVHLRVCKMWQELGVNLLECTYVQNFGEEMRHRENLSELQSVGLGKCIVILGSNVLHNVFSEFKLYLPYSTKLVIYQNETITCYYNVSKVLQCS